MNGSSMRAATVVGILLIVIGIVGFALGGFSYTHEKKDVDLGPFRFLTKRRAHYRFRQFSALYPLSPALVWWWWAHAANSATPAADGVAGTTICFSVLKVNVTSIPTAGQNARWSSGISIIYHQEYLPRHL